MYKLREIQLPYLGRMYSAYLNDRDYQACLENREEMERHGLIFPEESHKKQAI